LDRGLIHRYLKNRTAHGCRKAVWWFAWKIKALMFLSITRNSLLRTKTLANSCSVSSKMRFQKVPHVKFMLMSRNLTAPFRLLASQPSCCWMRVMCQPTVIRTEVCLPLTVSLVEKPTQISSQISFTHHYQNLFHQSN